MQYRQDRYGNPISLIGYGCMRFSKKGNSIDYEKTEKEILHGIESGINYYDTAYAYPGSEETLGRILAENNVREKVNIATKLPQYLVKKPEHIDKYFDEELRRLQTTYIDYYLMHMFTDIKNWENLVQVGIADWIEKKKAEGSIRQIGFSFHGDSEMFIKILNAYDWDFCQIQYNYMDENTQAGKKGLQAAAAKGIPVIIMEPLRGGKLVNLLPDEVKKKMAKDQRGWTPAEWSFRWLWNQPEVTCVLSGMNSMEMLDENIRIANSVVTNGMTEEDFKFYEEIKETILKTEKVGCTGCRYCMPCPKGVDIPGTFACYNLMYSANKFEGRFEYARNVGAREVPGFVTLCVECGKCETHCPQNIPIRAKLKEANKALRPLPYRMGTSIARKIMLSGKKQK